MKFKIIFGHLFHLKNIVVFLVEEKNSNFFEKVAHFQKLSKNLQNFMNKYDFEKNNRNKLWTNRP